MARAKKSYALYTLSANDEPVVVKHSAHTIGLYRSPILGDREGRWTVEAWTHALSDGLGHPMQDPAWFTLPSDARPGMVHSASALAVNSHNVQRNQMLCRHAGHPHVL